MVRVAVGNIRALGLLDNVQLPVLSTQLLGISVAGNIMHRADPATFVPLSLHNKGDPAAASTGANQA